VRRVGFLAAVAALMLAYLCGGPRVKRGWAGRRGLLVVVVAGRGVVCVVRAGSQAYSVLDRGAVGDMMVMGCCSRWGKRCGCSVFGGRPVRSGGSELSGAGRDGLV
jgi:hypothetical protein